MRLALIDQLTKRIMAAGQRLRALGHLDHAAGKIIALAQTIGARAATAEFYRGGSLVEENQEIRS